MLIFQLAVPHSKHLILEIYCYSFTTTPKASSKYKRFPPVQMIPSVCWIERGVAATDPHVLQLDQEELNALIQKTEDQLAIIEDGNESEDDGEEEEAESEMALLKIADPPKSETPKTKPVGGDTEMTTEEEFKMDDYDKDENEEIDGTKMFGAGLTGATYFATLDEDPYITLPSAAKDEEDTYEVKPTDNLICVAKLEGDTSSIEIHLWNEEEEDFYVHHDILLDKFPLSLEWLSYDAGEQEEGSERTPGNYLAVGHMSPQIEVWDLDIINSSEPIVTLGERVKPSKKKPKIGKKGHSDAVMCMSWSRQNTNILASGGADNTILLWDLETASAKEVLPNHKDKVQSLAWHLAESTTLLTGSYDNTCHVIDCRTKNSKTWSFDGEVECVSWTATSPFSFVAGTSEGSAVCVDIRQTKPLFTIAAHDSEVSGVAMSRHMPGLLVTCSADKTVKAWKVTESSASCVATREFGDCVSLHTIALCPDYGTMLAIGGLQGGLQLWDLATNREFREAFITMVTIPYLSW
eukprot:sb/3463847/